VATAAAAMGWRQGGGGEMWNSLSDVNVDSMTFCSYHSRKSLYLNVLNVYTLNTLNITFVVHKLAIERGVHFYTVFIMTFYSTISRILFLSRLTKTTAA